ncbi:MAG: alpha-1,2-fucosyltransferase [Nitrospirae bacterium YQR-1]
MIVVKLRGGIGNQMFQYAIGRRLSLLNKVPLKFDIEIYKTDIGRKYSLGAFAIEEHFATAHEIKRLSLSDKGIFKKVFNRLQGKKAQMPASYFCEKQPFHFDPEVFTHSVPLYLDGYFQSEKYFTDIEAVIRNDFTVKAPLSNINKELHALITETGSVSVHIRRGDYVTSKSVNNEFGVLPLDYYRKGVEILESEGVKPHIFLFSDDPVWCKENFKINVAVHFIEANSPDCAYEDLRLMSACKHHIIANSSFSWWGAWLGNYAEKKVIAPARWFRSTKYDTRDLIPAKWKLIYTKLHSFD